MGRVAGLPSHKGGCVERPCKHGLTTSSLVRSVKLSRITEKSNVLYERTKQNYLYHEKIW